MNCPKCNYDIFPIYDKVIETGKNSKYCKIVNIRPGIPYECIGGSDWDIECTCPKCKTKWTTSDSDY